MSLEGEKHVSFCVEAEIAGRRSGHFEPWNRLCTGRTDAALALLQNARAELEAAVPNKGGHRERAIELVDRAIVQVREGIAFAATH